MWVKEEKKRKENPTTTKNEEHRKKMEERKIALWHFWWRPAIYNTIEELELSIDDYFNIFTLEENIIYLQDKQWNMTWWDFKRVPSVTWLALHLGFKSRQSLIDYDWRAEYSDTIKKAKLFVENFNEERLLQWKGYWPWIMFNLKNNFDWKDKSEVDNINKNVDLNDTLTDEQKRLIANRILNDKWSDTINETNS